MTAPCSSSRGASSRCGRRAALLTCALPCRVRCCSHAALQMTKLVARDVIYLDPYAPEGRRGAHDVAKHLHALLDAHKGARPLLCVCAATDSAQSGAGR